MHLAVFHQPPKSPVLRQAPKRAGAGHGAWGRFPSLWLRLAAAAVLCLQVVALSPARAEADATREARHEILFQGNRAMGEAALRRAAAAELDAFALHGRLSDIDDAAFRMEVAYRKAGHAFATVEYRTAQREGRPVVTFAVSEGPRVILRKIDIRGASAFQAHELVSFFEGSRKGAFGLGELLYVRSDIESAASRIQDLYVSRGYLDAVVEDPRISFSEDRTQATVEITLREGIQYVIQDVRFEGDIIPAAAAALERDRRGQIGEPYVPRKQLILEGRVLEIYGNLGFPKAAAEVKEEQGDRPGSIVLVARIVRGPSVTVSEIRVEGNERVREGFIRNRIAFLPGDRFSLERQQQSFRRLYLTGLFSTVDIRLEEREGTDSWPLVVTVKEASSKEVYVEPGWGSYERLRLKAGFLEKNLFGTGRMGSVEALASVKAQSLVASLSDPWFLNTDIKADLPLLYGRREEPSFTRKDSGASILFSKKLTDRVSASAGYGFRRTELTDMDPYADTEGIPTDYDLASISIQAHYDTRNDLFFPTKGQKSFVSAEHADKGLGGEITFTRLKGGVRFFLPLARSTILGLRYSTGLILLGSEEVGVPLSENFFNGGENTVRSFRESELGPKDASGDPAGGLAFNVISVELRQRLIGDLAGTLFFDYGNISPNRTRAELGLPPYQSRAEVMSDTFHQFFKDFRSGVGCGIQYLLPVGALRIDFAVNPDPDKEMDEDRYAVHFSVGMAF